MPSRDRPPRVRGARPASDPARPSRRTASPRPLPRRTDGLGPRATIHGSLLVVGLVGVALTAWSMRETGDGARVAARLGLERVANNWHDVLELLALPALMFCAVLAVWSAFELYRLWRISIDPFAYGRTRRGERELPHRLDEPEDPAERKPPLRLRGPR